MTPGPIRQRRLLAGLLGVAAIALLALAVLASRHPYFAWDLRWMVAWQAVSAPGLGPAIHALTWLGDDWQPSLLVAGAAVALARFAGPRLALGLIASAVGGHLLSAAIKGLVGRPRPAAAGILVDRLRETASFPSGHVITFVSVFGFLFVIALLRMRRGPLRVAVLALLGLLVVGIGPSRVWLGEHWPSDVVGGYLTGACWLGAFVPLFLRWAGQPDSRRLGLLLVLALSGPGVAAADDALPRLAERYVEGDAAVVPELARWPTSRFEIEARGPWRHTGPLPDARRCAAVLLLDEALLRGVGRTRPGHRSAVILAAARILRHGATRAACGEARHRDLYLLLGRTALGGSQLVEAHDVLAEALAQHHDDAELLTAQGTVLEAVASLRTYEPPAGSRARRLSGFAIESEGSDSHEFRLPRASLADAERRFRAALARQPDLVEARLRLGRVLTLLQRPAVAIPELERAAAAATDSADRYLALLFLARAHDARGDLRASKSAHEAATAQAAGGQAAWIGLARALDRLGAAEPAQQALARALAVEPPPGDPWWGYPNGGRQRLADLLTALRAQLVR